MAPESQTSQHRLTAGQLAAKPDGAQLLARRLQRGQKGQLSPASVDAGREAAAMMASGGLLKKPGRLRRNGLQLAFSY
jgi:hypothetical protein